MKLLYTIHSVDPAAGGPIESLKQITPVMAALGHSTDVVSLDAPDAPCTQGLPFKVHAVGPGKGTYGYSPHLVPWLRQHAGEYNAVIVRGIWQYQSFATWRALRHSNTPYVVFPHGMLDPWFKHTFPLKHAKKWMYWPWAEYRVLRDAKAVLFTSEEERVLARESFWLYRCNEIVINYGTSEPTGETTTQKEAFFAKHPDLRNKRLALFLGRIHPKKACDVLIEAFAAVLGEHPEWHLVISGPDQVAWQQKLIALAHERKIAHAITWTGLITGDVKYGALKAAEVFVLPSHQENFGIVVAEALACGTPVLTSKKVNIWREVEQDEAGIVADDNFEGTCHLLRSWLALQSKEKQLMKERAVQCFRNRFEIKKSAESIVAAITPFITPPSQITMAGPIPKPAVNLAVLSSAPKHEDNKRAAV
ncbi:MAG TPA: glycosyltransferase [Terriglobales bacterium]